MPNAPIWTKIKEHEENLNSKAKYYILGGAAAAVILVGIVLAWFCNKKI